MHLRGQDEPDERMAALSVTLERRFEGMTWRFRHCCFLSLLLPPGHTSVAIWNILRALRSEMSHGGVGPPAQGIGSCHPLLPPRYCDLIQSLQGIAEHSGAWGCT